MRTVSHLLIVSLLFVQYVRHVPPVARLKVDSNRTRFAANFPACDDVAVHCVLLCEIASSKSGKQRRMKALSLWKILHSYAQRIKPCVSRLCIPLYGHTRQRRSFLTELSSLMLYTNESWET